MGIERLLSGMAPLLLGGCDSGCDNKLKYKEPPPGEEGWVAPTASPRAGASNGAQNLCDDIDQDTYCPPEDCDNYNSQVHPGASDPNDRIDNDCDGETDEDVEAQGRGVPRDGYPEGSASEPGDLCQDFDDDGVCHGFGPGEDCNDLNPFIPGEEICDRLDNDCDGAVDEGLENCDPVGDWVNPMDACFEEALPEGAAPFTWSCDSGETRFCGTCNYGEQMCVGGIWGVCDFQPPAENLEECACHQVERQELSAGFLFIFDTSGSMGEPYNNGVQKYWAAAHGIETILANYGDHADFGILAFPTRDCSVANEPQVPIGRDVAEILNILDTWGPGGNTPLAVSLGTGHAALDAYHNAHPDVTPVAILLSDGGESCGGDPITAAIHLLDAGIKLFLLDSSGGWMALGAAIINDMRPGQEPVEVFDVQNDDDLLAALDLVVNRFSVSVPYLQERCNGADDDCDGETDEGFERFSYAGPVGTMGVGICRPNEFDCVEGRMVSRVGALPSPEICDNQDNDCDGLTDECFQVQQPCKWFDSPEALANNPCAHKLGVTTCAPDGQTLVCEPPLPTVEICNGLDDDCNRLIDDVARGECPPEVAGGAIVVEDADGDGLTDDEEAWLGTDPHLADTDGDGLSDREDNCRLTWNPDQADANGDGIGDLCEETFEVAAGEGEGVIHYWSFDALQGNSVLDLSGANPPKDGELHGANGLPRLVAGIKGNAISCDGIDDYILTPQVLPIGASDQWTLSYWVFMNNVNNVYALTKISNPQNLAPNGNVRNTIDMIALPNGNLNVNQIGQNGTSDGLDTAHTVLHAGQWQHVALVRSGQRLHLYVDGVEKNFQNNPNLEVQSDTPRFINLCRELNRDRRYAPALFDEFLIHNRALDVSQVLELCEATQEPRLLHCGP